MTLIFCESEHVENDMLILTVCYGPHPPALARYFSLIRMEPWHALVSACSFDCSLVLKQICLRSSYNEAFCVPCSDCGRLNMFKMCGRQHIMYHGHEWAHGRILRDGAKDIYLYKHGAPRP